mgnify:CR=1 FL=1
MDEIGTVRKIAARRIAGPKPALPAPPAFAAAGHSMSLIKSLNPVPFRLDPGRGRFYREAMLGAGIKAMATVLALGAIAAAPALAATLADRAQGLSLIEREHYTDAFRHLEPLTALDDVEALYRTARLFEENQGQQAQALDEHDRLAEAARRFHRAAELGHADAAYRLARLLLRGVGVARDPAAGAGWMYHAAMRDHGKAQYEYGSLLAAGTGIARDEYAALTWYLLAAERNDVSPAEQAATAQCERLRRRLDLALEHRQRLEQPGQRFKPRYQKRIVRGATETEQYEILPLGIRMALDQAAGYVPEGPAAAKGNPNMPRDGCFSGLPES